MSNSATALCRPALSFGFICLVYYLLLQMLNIQGKGVSEIYDNLINDQEGAMAREEKEEQVVEDVPQKKKLPLKKLIVIGVAALVVVAGGTVGAIYYKKMTDKKEQVQQQEPVGAVWPMAPFIVNIQDQGTDRYLKIIIELEISDKNSVAELNQLKPKMRDNILDLLSAKSYKDIVDINGKQRLRDEIMMRLNSFLTGGKIVKVYFTEFVVQ